MIPPHQKYKLYLNGEQFQAIVDALNDQLAEGSIPKDGVGARLVRQFTNMQACYINYEHLDKMSDQEKAEMYDGLCQTFLGRPAK